MSAEAMGFVLKSSPYKGPSFACHVIVADTVNAQYEYEFWMSAPRLAKAARCGRTAAVAFLAQACLDGHLVLLESGRRRGEPSRYRFVMGGGRETTALDEGGGRETTGGRSPGDRGGGRETTAITSIETSTELKTRATDEFEQWWKLYPRHVDKARARVKYLARRGEGVSAEALLGAVKSYAASVANSDPKFIKHPATFLATGDGPWSEWLMRSPPRRRARRDVPEYVEGLDNGVDASEL